jgi:hypothetical protein
MIRRRAAAAGIETKLGNHSFRATGITAYLKNGGNLDAQACSIRIYASARHQGDTRIVEDASATIEAERLRIARGEIGGQIVLRREKAYERRARAERLCTKIVGFWSKGRVFGQARIPHESSRRRSITGRR